jgi:uncharacterized coiled-coil protein SlyX
MKKRNIIAVLFALVGFGLCQQVQAAPAPETPDPGAVGGSLNTADGDHALFNVTTGIGNAAFGWFSLLSNTDGTFNTAVGAAALVLNVGNQTTEEGIENTAVGGAALLFNTTGSFNTAVGAAALENNNTGHDNNSFGVAALLQNTVGFFNNAFGVGALRDSTGNSNTAIGDNAGITLLSGDGNVYIGASMVGVASESNHTYIRNINNTSVSGIGTDFVTVDLSTGLLGHATSSRRYKEDIKPIDKASEALYRLKPVTYRYKKEIDRSQSPAFGLIAEEVAEVNPNLVARNSHGQPESVHYEMVNAMLLNEFLKEHKKVEAQKATIAKLKSTVAQQQKGMEVLTAQLKEQAAQIQKVSAQLEVNKPAPQTVANK